MTRAERASDANAIASRANSVTTACMGSPKLPPDQAIGPATAGRAAALYRDGQSPIIQPAPRDRDPSAGVEAAAHRHHGVDGARRRRLPRASPRIPGRREPGGPALRDHDGGRADRADAHARAGPPAAT